MGQVGSNIWENESSKRNKDQHVSPSIWIVQDAARRDYQGIVYSFHQHDQQS